MPYKDAELGKQHKREYYKKNATHIKASMKVSGYFHRQALKKNVLTHYGKGGELKCCWDGCEIVDIDMLSIDHVNNDGRHRQSGYKGSGWPLYSVLKRTGYPEGFQTLCYNHQFKKELMRKRSIHPAPVVTPDKQ
jgi:hypothetical protein